jgi:hypothetical protein
MFLLLFHSQIRDCLIFLDEENVFKNKCDSTAFREIVHLAAIAYRKIHIVLEYHINIKIFQIQ